MRNENPT